LKKVKILHLVNQLGFDGTSKVVLNLCKLFNEQQYEISVISLTHQIDLINSVNWPRNIRVYTFKYYYDEDYSLKRYITHYLNRKNIRKGNIDILKCIHAIQPDILHCHLQPRELLLALQSNIHSKAQFLFTDHSVRLKAGQYSFINTWALAWIYQKIYSQFHVVAVAKGVAECHREYNLINPDKIYSVIENKIDTLKFFPVKKPSSPIRIVYVSRLDKRKGQDILIKAWAQIETLEKVELLIVGGGDFESELKSLVNNLRPKYPVIFAGFHENVLPFLKSAHIAVFPSLQEGLPIALLEKMSCGLPIIASDIPEFQEIIEDGKNGFFFRTGDANDLKDKLLLLIHNQNLRDSLGVEARQSIIKKYDYKEFKKEYKAVYTDILKRN